MQPIAKQFFRYGSLNIIAKLGVSCYILADTYFVAQGTGADGLTAMNLALPIFSFISGLGLMASMGGGARYSIFFAQRKKDAANRTFTRTCLFALLASMIFPLTGLLFTDQIVSFLGAEGIIHQMASSYLGLLMLFAPAFIMNNVLSGFVRNDGAPGLAMAAILAGSFGNIVLDYIFIFPMGMGMTGAALATCAAPVLGIAILSTHLLRGKNSFHFVRTAMKPAAIGAICSQGMSAFITEISSGVTMIVFNAVILSLLGNTGVAAYGVVANIALVVTAIFTGIAQGTQPLVSQSYGGGHMHQVKHLIWLASATALVFAAAVYGFVFVFANGITALLNSDGNQLLQVTAVRGLRIYFSGFLFAGPCIIVATSLSAAAFSREGFAISLCRGIVLLLPVLMICSCLLGMDGVWLCMPITEALTMGLALCLKRKTGI